jgi:tetratricopeptide (TPR) repeat protein
VRRPILWLPLLFAASLALAGAAAVPPANLSKAIDAQRSLVAEHPQDAADYNDLGNLLVLAGQTADAEAAYRKAIELAPDTTPAHFNLGLLLEQRGAAKEALKELRKAVQIKPDNAWACYQIGTLYEARGEDAQAVAWYSRAFALDPQLAFPEVNPAIIDSRLVTESLLRSYRAAPDKPMAPRAYEAPGRIAALLVPPIKPAEAEEQAAENAEETEQSAKAAQPKVLSDKNIKHGGSVGQATPPAGGTSTFPIRQGGIRSRASGFAAPRYEAPTEQPVEANPRLDIGVPLTRQPGNNGAKRKNGGHGGKVGVIVPGFQTGLSSTGRLEIRLVPEAEMTAPAG